MSIAVDRPASAACALGPGLLLDRQGQADDLDPAPRRGDGQAPQPQPISSRRWPGLRSRRSRRRSTLWRWAAARSPSRSREGLGWACPMRAPLRLRTAPKREGEAGADYRSSSRRARRRRNHCRGRNARRCWRGPCAGALSRRRWASALTQPERPLGAGDVAQRDGVGQNSSNIRHRVGAGPFALGPRLVPADRARGRRAGPAPASCRRWTIASGPGARKPSRRGVAVGQGGVDPALAKAAVDAVEDPREGRRDQPAEQPAAGGEAAVGAEGDVCRGWPWADLSPCPALGKALEARRDRGIRRRSRAQRGKRPARALLVADDLGGIVAARVVGRVVDVGVGQFAPARAPSGGCSPRRRTWPIGSAAP